MNSRSAMESRFSNSMQPRNTNEYNWPTQQPPQGLCFPFKKLPWNVLYYILFFVDTQQFWQLGHFLPVRPPQSSTNIPLNVSPGPLYYPQQQQPPQLGNAYQSFNGTKYVLWFNTHWLCFKIRSTSFLESNFNIKMVLKLCFHMIAKEKHTLHYLRHENKQSINLIEDIFLKIIYVQFYKST